MLRHKLFATLVSVTLSAGTAHAYAQCVPLLSLPITGDFELTLDPSDPPHLLYVTNQGDSPPNSPSPHNIKVAQIDGASGTLRNGPSLIATNYTGNQDINGPEFLTSLPIAPGHPFAGQQIVGLLYHGPGGVHAAFRNPNAAWDAFDRDVYNSPIPPAGPPPLPGTTPGSYPAGGFPNGIGYASFGGPCGSPLQFPSMCYGDVDDTALTPVSWFAAQEGLTGVDTASHPTRQHVVVVSGCTAAGACGLYRGTIDGMGGMLAAPVGPNNTAHFEWLASTGTAGFRRETLRGGAIPRSGTVMWAVAEVDSSGLNNDDIEVFSEDAAGALTSEHVYHAVSKVEHFRMVEGHDDLYLDYQVRDVAPVGSYYAAMGQSAVGAPFTFPAPVRYFSSAPFGVELVFLPGAAPSGRLAYYHGQTWGGSDYITRCWL